MDCLMTGMQINHSSAAVENTAKIKSTGEAL
jgi:hypothetical protein